MNFSSIFLLALALFGAVSQAYLGPVCSGVGSVGLVGSVGYNGVCGGECGTGYGAGYAGGVGYGGAYEGGYGCRTACGSAAVCDTCQCLKTIVRPSVVERIPYSCQRRVQASSCRTGCGLYAGGVYNGVGVGGIGSTCSGGVYGSAGVGPIGSTCSGYVKGGYLY